MLKALYDYAMREGLTLPAGYVNKTIRAYIVLSADGEYIGLEEGGPLAVPAPDIGSLANGKDKSNVLLEKRSVVIPEEPTLKSAFFLNALKDGGKAEPMLSVCAAVLEDEETAKAIRASLNEKKVKDGDRITFKVAGNSILESELTKSWWCEYRKQFISSSGAEHTVCLITGEPTVPMATTTPITGLYSVGGHGRGDALICFDKAAFCSYNLIKAANAPVSEVAFAAVKAALDDLLKKAPPKLAGMKFVHWYDRDIPRSQDPIMEAGNFGFPLDDEEDEDVQPDAGDKDAASEAKLAADCMIKEAGSGAQVFIPDSTSYYILLLSGVNGRVMIRRYERGTYGELKARLKLWREDLSLTNARGDGVIPSMKLNRRLMKLLKYQKVDTKPFERLDKELAGITPAILNSILSGGPLPEAVASRALAFIRSGMMSADGDTANSLFLNDVCVWQWLKVWLLRNKGKRGQMMSEYNPAYPSNAYHCGAMVAVYEAIQKAAMPTINATILQRYYASTIQTPALVIGILSRMAVHHLEKIENKGRAINLKRQLSEVSTAISGEIPTTLSLEGQSEFALGYYQMCAKLNHGNGDKKEKINDQEEG